MASKEHGIEAFNQEFNKYEQVNKEQIYHLAEHEDEDQYDYDFEINTCDIRQYYEGGEEGKIRFSQELGEALKGIGFAIITGHGVDPQLYRDARDKVTEVFVSTSREERMKYLAKRQGSVNQGYFPIKETTIIHPDLVEGWVFCRRAFNMDQRDDFKEEDYWPREGFEKFFRNIVLEHEKLILPIMQSALRFLGCDPHLYDKKFTGTNFGFRLNYYPPITNEDAKSGAGRMLGHEDVDFFTILPSQDVDGLQVLNRQNMKWIKLDPPEGSIILNTGDYMQRISNDIFPSTTHRVSKPSSKNMFGKPRITIPMAIYTWEQEILEVLPCCGEPKYEPIESETFHTRITSKYYGDDYVNQDK